MLCTTEPLKAQGITLQLTGEGRTAMAHTPASLNSYIIFEKMNILSHDWKFDIPSSDSKRSNTIPAGNHEWPFELVLAGDLPESIEGARNLWIAYRMKATIDRRLLAKNLVARKHIRLIRTLDPTSLELSHSASVGSTWVDKIRYNMSAPQKGVVFGSQIPVEFKLTPLLKGLRIGRVFTEVVETCEVTVKWRSDPSRTRQYELQVATDEYELPEDAETEDVEGAEGYIFTRQLQLPRKMRHCLQTAEEKNMRVRHDIKFEIALHNPDGHVSEVRAHFAIHIFISPNMRLNEESELDIPIGGEPAILDGSMAPPGYNEHQLDTLYTEIDTHTYYTPGPSQAPSRALSRRNSNEELDALDPALNSEVSANTLQNRLATLQTQDLPSGSESAQSPHALISAHSQLDSHESSPPSGRSRHSSRQEPSDQESGPAEIPPLASFLDPQHIEFNTEAMSRVPSYNTALQSATRRTIAADLPNYRTATSRPPSPHSLDTGSSNAGASSAGPPNPSPPNSGSTTPGTGRRAHFASETAEDSPTERRRNPLLPFRQARRQGSS